MTLRYSPESLILQLGLALAAAMTGMSLLIALPGAAAAGKVHRAAPPADVRMLATAYTGSIAGKVLGPSGSGQPGVCVIITGPARPRLTMTSARGQYAVAGLPPGRYQVRFESCRQPAKYFSLRYAPHGLFIGPGRPTLLRPVTLRLTNPRAELAARLAAFHRAAVRVSRTRTGRLPVISGTVRSASGKGLRGMCVYVVPAGSQDDVYMLATSNGGRYSIPAGSFRPGRYRVGFSTGCGSGANYAPQWWNGVATLSKATVLRVGKASHFTAIDAKLVTGGSITGIVRGGSRSGPGLSDVCVQVAGTGQGTDTPYEQEYSGAGGRYRIAGLAAGKYQVQFDPGCVGNFSYLPANYPHKVAVALGKVTSGIDIVLPKAASISGVVTASATGRPVAGICVFAIGNGLDNFSLAATDRRGRYTAPGLAAGRLAVEFMGGICGNSGSYASQWYKDEPLPDPDVPVRTGQAVRGINAEMRPGGTVKGRVTSTSGKPISGICVTVTSQQDWAGAGQTPIGLLFGGLTLVTIDTANSGRQGNYRVANLDPGLYNVDFASCRDGRYAAEWFHPGGGPGPAWASVAGGQPVVANVTLPPAGSISGVIRSPAGKPLSDVCAETFGLGGQVPFIDNTNAHGDTPYSDRAGRYKVVGLAPGRYALEFVPCGIRQGGDAAAWYKRANTLSASVKITVRSRHDTPGVDPVISTGQLVTGKITSGVTGLPVSGECVQPLSVATDVPRPATTNRAGIYRLNLLPGRHTLAVFGCQSRAKLGAVLRSVRVPRSGALTRLDVALPRQAALSGTLLQTIDRKAAAGVCAEAFPISRQMLGGFGQAGPNGRYLITGLAPGTYQVRFTSACYFGVGDYVPEWFKGQSSRARAALVRVRSGSTTRGVGGLIAGDGGISGTVRVSGKRAAGVCAIAFHANGPGAPVIAETARNGGYVIEDLTPGRYKVELTAGCGSRRYRTQWYHGARTSATATVVRVRAWAITRRIEEW